jgi:hypothetical protein
LATKEYLPKVAERLQRKINLTQNFMTLVTGHGNLKSYLHRFKIIEVPDWPCGNGNQTMEHVLFDCGILQEDRERLIAAIAKTDNWPINKNNLIKNTTRHLQNSRNKWTKSTKSTHKRNNTSENNTTREQPKSKRGTITVNSM